MYNFLKSAMFGFEELWVDWIFGFWVVKIFFVCLKIGVFSKYSSQNTHILLNNMSGLLGVRRTPIRANNRGGVGTPARSTPRGVKASPKVKVQVAETNDENAHPNALVSPVKEIQVVEKPTIVDNAELTDKEQRLAALLSATEHTGIGNKSHLFFVFLFYSSLFFLFLLL